MKELKGEFREYIKRLYGSQKHMAEALNVSENTVSRWVLKNPIPMLAHGIEIIRDCNTTETELFSEVTAHQMYLKFKKSQSKTQDEG